MVVFVNHYDAVVFISGNPSWQVKLAVSGSLRTKLGLECSVNVEHLDAVVATVSNNYFVVLVDTHSPWSRDHSVVMSIEAERQT